MLAAPSGCAGHCATLSRPEERVRWPKRWITPLFAALRAVNVTAVSCLTEFTAHMKVTPDRLSDPS